MRKGWVQILFDCNECQENNKYVFDCSLVNQKYYFIGL